MMNSETQPTTPLPDDAPSTAPLLKELLADVREMKFMLRKVEERIENFEQNVNERFDKLEQRMERLEQRMDHMVTKMDVVGSDMLEFRTTHRVFERRISALETPRAA